MTQYAIAPTTRIARPTQRVVSVSKNDLARRRFMRTATVLAVATVAVVSIITGQSATATNQSGSASFKYVTVLAGQSLWQIAAKVAPAEDPRDFIAEVVSLNNLTSAEVIPGQRIALPN
jgi:LysM repeat protein